MQLWKNDDELFAIARNELFSSVAGDAMTNLACSISSFRRRYDLCILTPA
jgi:hypothetical protein